MGESLVSAVRHVIDDTVDALLRTGGTAAARDLAFWQFLWHSVCSVYTSLILFWSWSWKQILNFKYALLQRMNLALRSARTKEVIFQWHFSLTCPQWFTSHKTEVSSWRLCASHRWWRWTSTRPLLASIIHLLLWYYCGVHSQMFTYIELVDKLTFWMLSLLFRSQCEIANVNIMIWTCLL